jgi:hypothetical protein
MPLPLYLYAPCDGAVQMWHITAFGINIRRPFFVWHCWFPTKHVGLNSIDCPNPFCFTQCQLLHYEVEEYVAPVRAGMA